MKRERISSTTASSSVSALSRICGHSCFDFAGKFLDAELVHQDLDAGLVDVVAAAVLVVDAQDRLDIAEQVAARHERLDGLADERRAAEAAADQHLEAGLAGRVPVQAQADVVNLDRGAVMFARR